MKTITIAHQKGGVGKTTLALNLAYCFAGTVKVAITDTDLQGSISNLGRIITSVDLVTPESVLSGELKGYDLTVIDTPPYLTNRLPDLFALSDYVLVPTKPGYLDLMAIRATVALLREAMKQRPTLRAGIVLNMVMPRNSLTAEVKELLQQYDLPVLPTMIHQRISYARSPMTAGVFESDDEKAKTEIQSLAADILNSLK
jgi:chromosome partitioning protein